MKKKRDIRIPRQVQICLQPFGTIPRAYQTMREQSEVTRHEIETQCVGK